MTIRLKNPRRVIRHAEATFAEEKRRLSRELEKELEKQAPVETGQLKASIKRGKGNVLAHFDDIAGVVQNARGPHRGWIQRAERKVLNR